MRMVLFIMRSVISKKGQQTMGMPVRNGVSQGGRWQDAGDRSFCALSSRLGINKKGQQTMGMPFGMIFAIFLIVVFVVFAFMAVSYFLDLGEATSVGMFYDELQGAVNDAVQGQESDRNFEINLPGDIEKVCFANLKAAITNPGEDYDAIRNYDVYDANTFLVPPEKAENMQWKKINRINVEEITKTKNPYCVDVDNGLQIKKGFYDRLVLIE